MLYTLSHALYVFTRSVTTPPRKGPSRRARSGPAVKNTQVEWNMAMAIRTIVRKWCNSLGMVIPKEEATKKGLREVDEVEVVMRKASDIRELFGKYEFRDLQKLKNELREGWP